MFDVTRYRLNDFLSHHAQSENVANTKMPRPYLCDENRERVLPGSLCTSSESDRIGPDTRSEHHLVLAQDFPKR
ncbi:GM23773 [Drosophila sechellia]|uniref:GM23773 n=1 Tax=Drosophila sechellia TaxID=7238 RepID=B4IPQ7_DROSE|nr:GM23773 [Drosophila sechellia]